MGLTFIDFFAGVGGFRRGMEMAGHKCLGHCEIDKWANESYKAIHNIKEDEWFESDIRRTRTDDIPRADCWCFGFPCQDISIAGKQLGFRGHRSSLFFTVTRLIRDTKEENKPRYLFIENVKNLLSINGGFDFLKLIIEMDEIGYNVEWQVFNSKDYGVPQNRERVFIIGHLRGRSSRKIFPVEGNTKTVINEKVKCADYRYDDGLRIRKNGETPCLRASMHKMVQKGDLSNSIYVVENANPSKKEMGGQVNDSKGISPTLTTNKGEGVKILVREATKKGYAEATEGDSINLEQPNSKTRRGRVGKQIANTLTTSCNQGVVVKTCLTPDRINKRQNGRRIKEEGEPSFTLTAQDRHGAAISEDGINYRIRKLTPRECWRLQGWNDEDFDKAASVCSDSQLYKQAGNGVTVNVIYAIAKEL